MSSIETGFFKLVETSLKGQQNLSISRSFSREVVEKIDNWRIHYHAQNLSKIW